MRVFLLTVLCIVALSFVVAADENEVKRGSFPFMAFIYYTDETIFEDGARFTRSAALISNDWLISSGDVSLAFPNKTLLARLGAIDIDQKFTLNEDEGEQEREVILILRPHNYSATEWWKTDISLLKTLLPFNTTSAIAAARLTSNPDPIYKNCYILIYSRRSANVTERTLMQMDVDLLPPLQEECGNYFSKETMACAVDSENNSAVINPNFCQGNRGGPLVCDNELIGLQTYINDCKQPHLYQLVIRWKKFINCAAEQRYLTQQCADISIAITKDPPSRTPETPKLAEAVVDILLDKFVTETTFVQLDAEATERSTSTTKVDEPTTTNLVISKSLETKREEKQITRIHAKENHSSDTTAYTNATEVTYTEEAVMESTTERKRKHRIEAQHQLVRGEASLNLPSLSLYLTLVPILAYT